MTGYHAPKGPSSMFRTVGCPGWLKMSEGIIDPETDDSREGDAVHEFIAALLNEFKNRNDTYVVHYNDQVGTVASNGVVYTEEMMDAVRCCIEIVLSVVPHDRLHEINIEQYVDIHLIASDNGGTPDLWWFDSRTRTLHVFDWKYGHKFVDPYENWQEMDYSVGIMTKLFGSDVFRVERPVYYITMHIGQPRCYDELGPHKKFTMNHTDMRPYINIMSVACQQADSDDPPVKTGEHCYECPGRIRCTALIRSGQKIVDYAGSALPAYLNEDALGYEMDQIEHAEALLKERKAGLEADIQNRVAMGIKVPGRRMEEKFTNRRWLVSDEEVIVTGDLFGVNLRKPEKAKTPAEADNELRRNNIDPSVIKSYYGRQPAGMRLVKDSNVKARLIFGGQS